jgi:hypothetical protein
MQDLLLGLNLYNPSDEFRKCIEDRYNHPEDKCDFYYDNIRYIIHSFNKFSWVVTIFFPENHPDKFLNNEEMYQIYSGNRELIRTAIDRLEFSSTEKYDYTPLTNENFHLKPTYKSFAFMKNEALRIAMKMKSRSLIENFVTFDTYSCTEKKLNFNNPYYSDNMTEYYKPRNTNSRVTDMLSSLLKSFPIKNQQPRTSRQENVDINNLFSTLYENTENQNKKEQKRSDMSNILNSLFSSEKKNLHSNENINNLFSPESNEPVLDDAPIIENCPNDNLI